MDVQEKRINEETSGMSAEFVTGVEEFICFASNQEIAQRSGGKFYCPCIRCQNKKFLLGSTIWKHILGAGFMPNYYVWYYHGEDVNVDLGGNPNLASSSNVGSGNGWDNGDSIYENCYVSMVNDAFPGYRGWTDNHVESGSQNAEQPHLEAQIFFAILESSKKPLYEGCREGHSQLSLAARIMNNKSDYNMSEKCVDSWAELLHEYLPEGNEATRTYYETERLIRNLGLPFYTIDVCQNNCMLFWRADEKWDQCRFCNAARYKNSGESTLIPFSKMWYLPIADRLKRLYQSETTASAMTWHAEHQSADGEMCHPSDGSEWKRFQSLHPSFSQEPRNVYIGLCTDRFNPFDMSRNHSLWPVILTPYNLPPAMFMEKEFLFLTILNSGPNHPRSSLDIFLQPLIEELKELWCRGVQAYDVSRK